MILFSFLADDLQSIDESLLVSQFLNSAELSIIENGSIIANPQKIGKTQTDNDTQRYTSK